MNTAAIVVIYKNTSKDLEGIRISLIRNGLKEMDIYFSDNTNENLGYAGGVNRVLKKILKKYDYFFILNPDTVLYTNCLKKLGKVLEENINIGMVGPKILDANRKVWSLGGVLDKKRFSGGLLEYGNEANIAKKDIYDVDYIPGTVMLIRRDVFEKIGLFTEDYFLYYEDDDMSFRIKKSGFRIVINPNAIVTHFASSTIGKDSPMMHYYLARNHMLFVERFAPATVKLHELLRLPKTVLEATKYERIGIRDYLLRRFGKHDYWS